MFGDLDLIPKVIYAPVNAFKKIVENPKYLAVLVILLLFVGIMVGYEYTQFSGTYTENTSPTIDQLYTYTNATSWTGSSGVSFTNNFNDFYNYSVYVAAFGTAPTDAAGYYRLFGNTSLEITANNTSTVSAAIGNVFNVDCSQTGFQNLSMTIKLDQPQTAPQNVNLTLYSLGDANYYRYDLTPMFANMSANGEWNNLTIPISPRANNWTTVSNPTWGNITALQLDFTYPTSTNITMQIGALFFHGQYLTPIQYNSTGILLQFLQVFSLQFIFAWFLVTGLIYLLFYLLKNKVTWKPLFVAVGFALVVMVIRALVTLVATATLPPVYYPYDLSLGVRFDPYGVIYYPAEAINTLGIQSQAAFHTIDAATAAFRAVTSGIFIVAYVWLAALGTIIVGTLKPEFAVTKRIAISAVSVVVTIVLLLLLLGIG